MSIKDLVTSGNLPNILLIITDQQRTLQHYPEDFLDKHLPAMARLMRSGLTFENGFVGSCMCAPSRATLMTSNYPPVHGVMHTGDPAPPVGLPPPSVFPNLATVFAAAGYKTENIVWKGKWHVGGRPEAYGFASWNPPDSGTNERADGDTLGGGTPDNDGRYLRDIVSYLQGATSPFCLVASFVNPHDVFIAEDGPQNGYAAEVFEAIPVSLPDNRDQELSTMPRAQALWRWKSDWKGTQQGYVNFYAYLQRMVDLQIEQVLEQLERSGLLASTLIIRIADHGEMGLSHGMIQKDANAYDETINIPLIFSNPVVWPAGQTTSSLASLIDLAPTLAALLGVSDKFTTFKGQDLCPILDDPAASVQDSVHFTFDDGSPLWHETGPSIVRTVRTAAHVYSVYFNMTGTDSDWELYDLAGDPDQNHNVAGTQAYAAIQDDLDRRLQRHMRETGTHPLFAWPPKRTSESRG